MLAIAEKNEMCIMDKTGDTKLIWDPNNPDEVANAKRTFDDLKGKGYLAFSVQKGGDKGEVLREFNPQQEKIILAPPVVGG